MMLWNKPTLTTKERDRLTVTAVNMAIDRNLSIDHMSKCVIARNFRELWVFSLSHPNGERVI